MNNTRRTWMAVTALASLSLAGCSLATGATPAKPAPLTPVTVTATPAASAAPVAVTPVTVTVTSPPPVTVTVAPPAAPAPAPVAAHYTGPGAFVTPSGNITCALFSYGGDDSVRCEVATHDWVAPPKEPSCQLDWGSRLQLNHAAGALFDCYAQNLPTPDRTLPYGSTWAVGSLVCDSETAGVTCTDNGTGHYFFVSRQTWRIG
jgi:hypothetical protein